MHKVQTLLLALQCIDYYRNDRCAWWWTTNHVTFFKVWQWLDTVDLLFSSHTDSKVCNCVVSLSPSDKPMWHFTNKDNQKREKSNKETKSGKAGSEIQIKCKQSSRRNSWLGLVTLPPFLLDMSYVFTKKESCSVSKSYNKKASTIWVTLDNLFLKYIEHLFYFCRTRVLVSCYHGCLI